MTWPDAWGFGTATLGVKFSCLTPATANIGGRMRGAIVAAGLAAVAVVGVVALAARRGG